MAVHWELGVVKLGVDATRLLTEQVRILLLLDVVDQGDVQIGRLLHLVEGAALVVFRDLVILQQLLQLVVGVAARGTGWRTATAWQRTDDGSSTTPIYAEG